MLFVGTGNDHMVWHAAGTVGVVVGVLDQVWVRAAVPHLDSINPRGGGSCCGLKVIPVPEIRHSFE